MNKPKIGDDFYDEISDKIVKIISVEDDEVEGTDGERGWSVTVKINDAEIGMDCFWHHERKMWNYWDSTDQAAGVDKNIPNKFEEDD